jgi:hypothetical protein
MHVELRVVVKYYKKNKKKYIRTYTFDKDLPDEINVCGNKLKLVIQTKLPFVVYEFKIIKYYIKN